MAGTSVAFVLIFLLHCPARGEFRESLVLDGTTFRVEALARRATYDVSWEIQAPPGGADPIRLDVVFAYQSAAGQYYRIGIDPENWQLTRTDARGVKVLGRGRNLAGAPIPGQTFVLKRRRLWISGFLGGRRLFRLPETGSGRGTVASAGAPAGLLSSPRMQPVAESDMVFRDDFMRGPEEREAGVWQLAGGGWRLQSYADKWRGQSPLDPMNTARSTNPFVYRGTGNPQALALAGQLFWDDLTMAVSVRSQGGRAGWVFACRDPDNYHVLWWEPVSTWEEPSRFAIERVRDGNPTVLAETRQPGQREQWYRISVDTRGDMITAAIQGEPVLTVADADCAGGRFGMCAAQGEVDFDDVDVCAASQRPLAEPWMQRLTRRVPEHAWRWTATGVRGEVTGGADSASLLTPCGEPDFRRLAVTVAGLTPGLRRLGICLGVTASERTVFTWDAATERRPGRRLLHQRRDREKLITQAQGGFPAGQALRLIIERAGDELRVHELNAGLLLRVKGHRVPSGAIGLIAEGRGAIIFRDLVINGEDERDWEKPIQTQVFRTDHYMLDWSAADGQWVRDPTSSQTTPFWWHKGDFFGAIRMTIPLAAAMTPPGARIHLLARDTKPGRGYELRFAPQSGRSGKLRATLFRQGQRLAKTAFVPAPEAQEIELARDGAFLWINCGDQEPLFTELPPQPEAGTRVGVQLPKAAFIEQLKCRRDHLIDEQFDAVPTNWRHLGRWEVSNKFHCDPRWAYMVGEADGLAALWHLDEFPGDMTLEFYAGMRYRSEFNFMPHYPRPGDLNAVIGSDSRSVFDGYTAIVSGWDTTWTRLLRNGSTVAETDRFLVPSTRSSYPRPQDLHRKWFYVKIRRVGPRVELYFENEKVLSWSDPEPLKHGRLALWTYDNSILIARVKIAYSRRIRGTATGQAPAAPPPSARGRETGAQRQAARLASDSHPGCRFPFDRARTLSGWTETGDTDDARLSWQPDAAATDGGYLSATNVNAGGRFIVPVPVRGLDLRRAQRLSFSCRLTPGARTNLYLRTVDRWYYLHLTGPDRSDENLTRLGHARVRDDGAWHTVDFPIGAAFLREQPGKQRLLIQDMHFGVRRGRYVLAGLNANPAGARLDLDDFTICAQGGSQVRARLLDADGTPLHAGVFAVTRDDGTSVHGETAFTEATITAQLEDGAYTLTAKSAGTASAAGATLSLQVRTMPTASRSISPASGSAWGGEPIVIAFAPDLIVPIWNLVLRAGDRSFSPDGQVLAWDDQAHALRFDPTAAALSVEAEKTIPFALHLSDQPDKLHDTWQLTFSPGHDQIPPRPPRLHQYLINDTFEDGKGGWTRIGRDKQNREHGARLLRDPSDAGAGRYSLKLFNDLVGGVAGAQISARTFNAGRYPLLRFDCRMEEKMLLDLVFTAGGRDCRLTLTDNDHRNTAYPVGTLTPPFHADGQWHRLEANWQHLLARAAHLRNPFSVSNLRLIDHGWQGNPEGATCWVDNFQVIPCLSAAAEGIRLSWDARDLAGIAGYSYHWSAVPREDADTVPEGAAAEQRFEDVEQGRMHFHIRAQDLAGNWSDTSDWLFLIDNSAPIIAATSPAPNTQSANRTIEVEFQDPGGAGVDPASLALTVNGRTFTPGSPGVTLDLARGRFRLDWVEAQVCAAPADGFAFDAAIRPLRDFAGNTGKPKHWQWTFARNRDKRAPLAPEISWRNGKVSRHFTFEKASPQLSASAPTWLDRMVDETRATHVQRVTIGGRGVNVRVTVPGRTDAEIYRYLSFRYRFPPNLKIDLSGTLRDPNPEKRLMIIKLTDAEVRPDYVTRAGRVDGIQCDDQWHAATVDLKQHVEQREHLEPGATPSDWRITGLAFADAGFNWHDPGTVFYLDDILLAAPGPATATFALTATDESGIAGFACSVDRDPDGIPPENVNVKPNAGFEPTFPAPGIWYVHARALDQAGNWSRPAHFTYVVAP